MSSSRRRAVQAHRSRLGGQGLARFEVVSLDADRALVRLLAHRLVEGGPEADRVRAALGRSLSGEPPRTGGIAAALRRSPFVGAELDLARPEVDERAVDL